MKKLWASLGVIAFWCLWPLLWLYLRGTYRTRLLIIADGEFLVLRGWLGAGNWSLPGGGLHKGEKPLDGLMREVSEETGLNLNPNKIKFLYNASYNEYGFSFAYDCYQLELPEKPTINPPRWEIVDYSWLPIKDSGHRLTADTREALDYHQARTNP